MSLHLYCMAIAKNIIDRLLLNSVETGKNVEIQEHETVLAYD